MLPRRRSRVGWVAALALPARVFGGGLAAFAGAHGARRAGAGVVGVAIGGCAGAALAHVALSAIVKGMRRRWEEERLRAVDAVDAGMRWSDALEAVEKVVACFSDGLRRDLRYVFLDTSLVRLHHDTVSETFQDSARVGAASDDVVASEGRYFAEYCMAAYGYMLLKLLGMMDPSHDFLKHGTRNIDIVKYRLRLPDEKILDCRLDGSGIGVPRHFIAVDDAKRAIVVALRGTNSISDVITDLLCGNEPFAGGYAHGGMKSAAESLYTLIVPILRDALGDHPGYELVLTGHSLGAGVAILLCKVLLMNGFDNVRCFAIAPCPVFGPLSAIDEEWGERIEAFVHHDDIVPQLSLFSARALALEIERVDELNLSLSERKDIMRNKSAERLGDILQNDHRARLDPREAHVEQLYIPTLRGIHWLLPAQGKDAEGSPGAISRSSNAASSGVKERERPWWRSLWGASAEDIDDADIDAMEAGQASMWSEAEDWNTPPASKGKTLYCSHVVSVACFARLLITPGCVQAHFPSSYTSAFASLPIPAAPSPPLPPSPMYSRSWLQSYNGELG